MTALEVVEAHLAARRALGVLLDRQGRFLRQFVRETGNTPLSDVTPTAVASFLRGRGMPTATWRAKRASLAGLYRYAISRGFAAASPLPEHPPKLSPPQTPYVYSSAELQRLLDATAVLNHPASRLQSMTYRMLLLLLYGSGLRVGEAIGVPVDRLSIDELSPVTVRRFLDHVEQERHCSVSTRNQRLGAIHSLARFIGSRAPEHLSWCAEMRSVPFKKTAKTIIGYLEKSELDALLRTPDRRTTLGARDHALLLFLYNTGARADETARLTAGNLQLGTSASARILGKGNKWRVCPLWPATMAVLRPLVRNARSDDPVFRGRTGKPLTRFGVHRLVAAYGKVASVAAPTLATKRVSPHTMRHTTAVHLLRAGVDINTIRAWLGHVSLDTTHVYAEVDLDMKAKALAGLDISDLPTSAHRRRSMPSLMEFLRGL